MTSRLTLCVFLTALMVVLSSLGTVQAQEPAGLSTPVGSPDSRVRSLDPVARRVLELAVTASPTAARMVAELERTDLIVGIQALPLPKFLRGEVMIITATRDVRHVRIRIQVPNGMPALAAVLGHELRHALEIASMPEVRDAASLRAAYRKIGWASRGDGYFETDAADQAGRAVEREIAVFSRTRVAAGHE